MRRNQRTDRESDRRSSERWDNEGGHAAPTAPRIETESGWLRAIGRHWQGYKPTAETQGRAEVQARTRAQKPFDIPSYPPQEGGLS
ncbi:hypothetical protein GCM10009860_21390 [Microbacterium mitrae]